MPNVTYDRPVDAKLVVQLSNGERWDATEADLKRFGLAERSEMYAAFDVALRDALTSNGVPVSDITDVELNPLRYLVEVVICYPDLLTHADHDRWSDVADLERRLRSSRDTKES